MKEASTTTKNGVVLQERKKKRFGVNTNLIMLKLSLFFLYGATSSLLPYLTIHMQSIGLKMEEIAVIYLALPFTTFLAPPVTGFLVDKFGQYKPVVIISFVLNAALHHSLLLIPHQETPGIMPNAYVMRHPKQQLVEVWWSPCPSRECPEEEEIDFILDMCVDHCLLKKLALPKQENEDPGDKDDLVFHVGKSKPMLVMKKTIPKKVFLNDTAILIVVDMHSGLGDPVVQLGIAMESDEDDDTTADYKKNFPVKLLKKQGVNITELEEHDLRCGGIVTKANDTSSQRLNELAGDCMVQKCNFREGGPELCPPDFKESDDRTFWIYFTLRFLASIMMTAGVTIMDPIALTMIEKYGGDFGREKLFSSLGMALFSPITGIFIDLNSKRLGYTDYSAAFYTYDVLLIISALTVFLMPLGTKIPADNIFRDLLNIFKMTHVIIFIVFLYFLGNFWGFIESFLFLYLKDLGAPNYLLGITVTVGTISSLPFLYGAEKITTKIGHVNIIIIAFFAHAARLMGYSFIENAWWCFPFEAMESLSVHLMWVAAATYCTILAPKNLLATLIGVTGMAHFSIGRGSGSFVGGHLIGKFGIRQAFRIMGLIAIIAGLIYIVIHYFWLRIYDDKNLDDEDMEFGETDKLKENNEPKFKDQSTMVSFERLSLMIEYNQIGSLSSLGRLTKGEHEAIKRARSNSIRRGSYNIGMFKQSRGSTSKVDILKSASEVNQARHSNPHLKNSTGYIGPVHSIKICDPKTSSTSKLTKTPVEDNVLDKHSIPDETDEIIYDSTKKVTIEN